MSAMHARRSIAITTRAIAVTTASVGRRIHAALESSQLPCHR
jgi:hypothetical protein